jgi:polysaccharide export outer membrane protein
VGTLTGVLLGSTGCVTLPETPSQVPPGTKPETVMRLIPGDEVEISVFGAPELSLLQRVRPDGKISAKLFGDIEAAGKTPSELQAELTKLYEPQLQIKAITVVARTSAAVYVAGAVLKPGKVELVRPMTALDAIMEAGGFDLKGGARQSKVKVIRNDGVRMQNFDLDLEGVLTKGGEAPFYLKPFDTVYVPGSW